jgi:hypothetical protein
VFVAVKPFGEQFASQTRKQQLRESILNRVPLAVDPVFIDAEYTYIVPSITTYYNRSQTTINTSAIEQAVRTAITDFSTDNLERFGNRLRYSRFVRALDNIQFGSIFNNDASLTLEKRFTPNINTPERIVFQFNNPIREGTLESTQFTFNGFSSFIDDDGEGNVRIYRFDENRQKTVIISNAGTVNYDTGLIEIERFAPTAYSGIEMKISITPDRLDVIPVREQILIMNANDATITLVGETD